MGFSFALGKITFSPKSGLTHLSPKHAFKYNLKEKPGIYCNIAYKMITNERKRKEERGEERGEERWRERKREGKREEEKRRKRTNKINIYLGWSFGHCKRFRQEMNEAFFIIIYFMYRRAFGKCLSL